MPEGRGWICNWCGLLIYSMLAWLVLGLEWPRIRICIRANGLSIIKSGTNARPILTKAGWAWHATIYFLTFYKCLRVSRESESSRAESRSLVGWPRRSLGVAVHSQELKFWCCMWTSTHDALISRGIWVVDNVCRWRGSRQRTTIMASNVWKWLFHGNSVGP